MPLYRFECQDCKKAFAQNLAMSEYAALQKSKGIACPTCSSTKVARVFTAPSVMRSTADSQSGGSRSGGCGSGCGCC